MRKLIFDNGSYYHVFNRGVDHREIFQDEEDRSRFFQGMHEFNVLYPIGSLYEQSFRKGKFIAAPVQQDPLVNFIAYCLNPNHYHFILEQCVDHGVEKFMHRLGVGYSKYFNTKYKRTGSLFQGTFKAVHIDSNEYLLYVSAYVNLNHDVHKLGNLVSKSSWNEYVTRATGVENFCKKSIILDQFRERDEYIAFAKQALLLMQERKDLERFFIE